MKLSKIVLFISLLAGAIPASAQEEWKLHTDKDGIKVYSAINSASKFKPIKVECIFDATAAQLIAVLLDIKNYPEWAYHTKSTYIVKQVSPSELYYYGEVKIPWPGTNRDFVAHVTVMQDPVTKIITLEAPAAPGMVADKEGLVRIHSKGKWIITPMGKEVKVVYFLQIDPGGGAPAWLVNMFAADGPFQSFKSLKIQLQKPAYKNITLPFIKN